MSWDNGLGRCWCNDDQTTGGHSHHDTIVRQPREGWKCPECGRVYAPWVIECKQHRANEPQGMWR